MKSISLKVCFCLAMLAEVLIPKSAARAAEPQQFPHYRHVDKLLSRPTNQVPQSITLLADEDFAPFSFKTADGKLAGIAVQLAMAACSELKTKCVMKSMPFSALQSALQSGQGDVVIAGPQLSRIAAEQMLVTRPYYFAASQFLRRNGSNLAAPDAKTLAGRRVGFVKGSRQEKFLATYFERSSLVPFAAESGVFESLRTGGLDAGFVDALNAGFWLKGSSSRGCCEALGPAFFDKPGSTRGLAMVVGANQADLRENLDIALDRLQESGITAKILATFLPSSPM